MVSQLCRSLHGVLLQKRFALCKPPAGAPFFCFVFLGAQKNEVAEGMKRKYIEELYLYHNSRNYAHRIYFFKKSPEQGGFSFLRN